MKRFLVICICVLALGCLAGAAWAQQGGPQGGYYGPGYGMGPGMMGPGYGPGYGMMGPGYGPGYGMGPGMMGPGYGPGPGMGPGYGRGYGMMGPGYGPGYGMRGRQGRMGPGGGYGPNYQGWQSMSPKDRKAWQEMFYEHQKDTLELRQKLVTKQMELRTLWSGPDPDQSQLRELAKEVGELRSELAAKQNQYLLQCRKKFGDKGWTCPGRGY